MSDRPVLLLAASGLARETVTVLRRQGRRVIGYLDDEAGLHGTRLDDLAILGPLDAVVDHPEAELVLCAGKGRSRMIMADRLLALGVGDDRFGTVISPDVHVPANSSVGVGSILLAGTVLTSDVTIGRHVVIMPRVVLTHDDKIDDFATLCAGVTLGGHVQVARAAYLGMGSAVREHVRVGAGSVLGMGASLLADLPAGRTWAGVPARDLDRTHTTADHLTADRTTAARTAEERVS